MFIFVCLNSHLHNREVSTLTCSTSTSLFGQWPPVISPIVPVFSISHIFPPFGLTHVIHHRLIPIHCYHTYKPFQCAVLLTQPLHSLFPFTVSLNFSHICIALSLSLTAHMLATIVLLCVGFRFGLWFFLLNPENNNFTGKFFTF